MRKIAWYGPSSPTPRQAQELQRLFGADIEVDFRGQIGNAAQSAADFRSSGAEEAVMVAPLAMLEHVLKEGVHPLWSEAESIQQSHPEAEWKVRDQWFRFVRFRRLTALELVYADRLEPIQTPPGRVRIGWFTQHPRTDEAVQALRQLYDNLRFEIVKREFRDARDVMAEMRQKGVNDLVFVAPLSLFDALTKQGIYPIQPQLVKGQVVLRRVTGLRMEFKDFD